jgi:hypothetical protein
MWIFDSYFKGCVELWSRERGLERISAAYPPSFYMHLKDPHAYWEMVDGLQIKLIDISSYVTITIAKIYNDCCYHISSIHKQCDHLRHVSDHAEGITVVSDQMAISTRACSCGSK